MSDKQLNAVSINNTETDGDSKVRRSITLKSTEIGMDELIEKAKRAIGG